MNNSIVVSILEGHVLLLAVGMTRLATAFIFLPLFSSDVMPALVRNSVFVSLALVVLTVHPPIDPSVLAGSSLIRIFAAEAFWGISLGFFFGLFLWAFEAAGEVIDTAIGTSMAMIHDPISGNEVTLIGEFLGRWVNYLFMASGGLLLITGVLLESYSLWPIGKPLPAIDLNSVTVFENKFSEFFALILMIAAPFLLLIFLVDVSMGLVNRFAQQMNVLFLSISIKSILSLFVLALLLPSLIDIFLSELELHSTGVFEALNALFVSN